MPKKNTILSQADVSRSELCKKKTTTKNTILSQAEITR